MLQLESLMHSDYGCALDCQFVAAGILPAAGVWTFWKSRLGSTGLVLGYPEGIASLSPG
jgi:hypothetical protein